VTVEPLPRLRDQRDFQLLWLGQTVSALGSRVTSIALPLLVLAATGSPAQTGLTAFVFGLPLLLLTLPAGLLVDRWDRRLVMVAANAVRFLALGSLAAALLLNAFSLAHVLLVAFVGGAGYTVFTVAERSSLRHLVPRELLPAATAQNQARESVALLAGQPLGGLLFSLGRAVPFVFDAISYLVALVTLTFIRRPLQDAREPRARRLLREVVEGLAFLWRQPFLRVTSLLVTGSDVVLNALFLTVIVIARAHGASATEVGLMVAFLGIGGLAGAAIAPALARRLSLRQTIVLTMAVPALLVPLVAVVTEPLLLGAIYGAMFVLHPTWDALVGTYRLLITPDRLQGRVQSVYTLLSASAVPTAFLAIGILLEAAGSTATVVSLVALMVLVAAVALASRAVRDAPPPPDTDVVVARVMTQ
jgi:predicted MFS family arabinose efflux permease